MRPYAPSNLPTSKFFALAGLGFVLTLTTVFLGSPFIRVLHKVSKPLHFWAFGILASVAFILLKVPMFATILASVWFLVGIYGELEKRGRGWKWASLMSLLVSSGILIGGMIYALWMYDINSWDRYVLFLSEMFENVQKMNPSLKFDTSILAQQTPSMLVSLLVTALGNALIFDQRAAKFVKVPIVKVASQLKLMEFRLPDAVIWVFLLAFLFSLVNFNMPWLSVVGYNLVNIGVILFFFQGLAVLEVFFLVMKTSFFFRVLTYIILVGYLFVLLSALGLIDYWVDFRSRLRRLQTAESN
jgi:hypothetical protein